MRHLVFEITAGYPHVMTKAEMTELLNRRVKEINIRLAALPGVHAEHSGTVYLGDTKELAAENPDQARVMYSVRKDTRKTTWDDVMGEVNKVYAPKYNFVKF